MNSIDDILKMAQNVQAELEKAQANLDTIEVEGASGVVEDLEGLRADVVDLGEADADGDAVGDDEGAEAAVNRVLVSAGGI